MGLIVANLKYGMGALVESDRTSAVFLLDQEFVDQDENLLQAHINRYYAIRGMIEKSERRLDMDKAFLNGLEFAARIRWGDKWPAGLGPITS